MPIVPVSIGKRSNPTRYGQEGAARLINCWGEEIGEDGKHSFAIYSSDGLSAFATLTGGGATRAALVVDSSLYVVSGRLLFRIDAGGSVSTLGGIPSDGMVTMARNRRSPDPEVAIVCDGQAWIVQAGALNDITDPDLPPPTSVCDLDGYFIYTVQDGRWYISSIDDGSSIDGLEYATAQVSPDTLTRSMTRGRDLCLFGPSTVEYWQNVGAADFPFQRLTSIEVGTKAPDSVARVDQTIAFVAHDNTVRVLDGYQARTISNHAVARAITACANPMTIKGYSWQRDGHTFYAIATDEFTWVYNLTTGMWHEEVSDGLSRRKIALTVQFGEDLIAGHYSAGKLYRMAPDLFTDGDGDPLIMDVRWPTVHTFPASFRAKTLFIDAVTGVGIATGATQDVNPVMMLSWSQDGGKNFGSEREVSLGTINQPLTKIRVNGLGSFGPHGVTFRTRISAAVARAIMAANLDIEPRRP